MSGTRNGGDILTGDDTLADAHLRSFVDWPTYLSIDVSAHEHLQAWAKRCAERPTDERMTEHQSG